MEISHFDSQMQVFGSAGWKIIWQIWIDYQSSGNITVSIYGDDNILFYQQVLTAPNQRNVHRFYLPSVNTPSGGSPTFNKSQSYRIVIDAAPANVFQLYRDGSRIEVRNLSTDQRQGFDSKILWEWLPVESI